MEVGSAAVKDDTAEILVVMTDWKEDCVDGTTDFFDSYYISNSAIILERVIWRSMIPRKNCILHSGAEPEALRKIEGRDRNLCGF